MNRVLMCFKSALLSCPILAKFTKIHNTSVFIAYVMIQSPLTFITCFTFLTLVQLLVRPKFITTRDIKVNNFISNIQDASYIVLIPSLIIIFSDFVWNTSLAALGALAHRLQRRTALKIQNFRQGPPKWPTGSGKGFNSR